MGSALFKLLIGAGFASVFFVVVRLRRRHARARLAEFDSGSRCVGCDSPNVVVAGDSVRCDACGYVTSLSTLRKEQLTDAELHAATDADRNTNLR